MFLIFSLIGSSILFSQGSAVITPSFNHSFDSTIIKFTIQNQVSRMLDLKYTPICDVNGIELQGEPCEEFFEFILSGNENETNKVIRIKPNGKAKATVRLKKDSGISFALFKPLFDPIIPDPTNGSGVRFIFNYQPGYLFLKDNKFEKLPEGELKIQKNNFATSATFKFDLTKLSFPQITSASARITDKKTKKTLKFGRFANNKIFDPKRKDVTLSIEYAKPDFMEPICYTIYFRNQKHPDKTYKQTGCSE